MKQLLFLLILIQACFPQSQIQVSLNNEKGKTNYFISESIYLKLSIVNSTKKLLEFKSEYLSKQFYIKGENDYFLEPYLSFSNETHFHIFPSDSFVIYWDITTAFNQGNKVKDLEYGLPPDKYVIYYKYANDKLRLESNQLHFRVTHPPDIEKKAFDLYSQAMQMFRDSKNKNQLQKTNAFLKVVEEYPKSVYAPSALYFAQITGADRENLGIRLINEYPSTPEIWNLLNTFMNRCKTDKNKNEAESFLRKLISNYQKTFVAKEAQNRLFEIERLSLEEWLKPELVKERKLKEYYERHLKQ